jgi:hypothetical protein
LGLPQAYVLRLDHTCTGCARRMWQPDGELASRTGWRKGKGVHRVMHPEFLAEVDCRPGLRQ